MASSFDQKKPEDLRRKDIEDRLCEWGKWTYDHGCFKDYPLSLYEQVNGRGCVYYIGDEEAMHYDQLIAFLHNAYPEMLYKEIALRRYVYRMPFELIPEAFSKEDKISKHVIVRRHDFIIGFIMGNEYKHKQNKSLTGHLESLSLSPE